MPSGLESIVYKLVSLLTLKPLRLCPVVGIDSLQACVRVDIETFEIEPSGLASIVYKLFSMSTLKFMRLCLCLALIVYELYLD